MTWRPEGHFRVRIDDLRGRIGDLSGRIGDLRVRNGLFLGQRPAPPRLSNTHGKIAVIFSSRARASARSLNSRSVLHHDGRRASNGDRVPPRLGFGNVD